MFLRDQVFSRDLDCFGFSFGSGHLVFFRIWIWIGFLWIMDVGFSTDLDSKFSVGILAYLVLVFQRN